MRTLKILAVTLGGSVLALVALIAWFGISLSLDNRIKHELLRVAAPDGTHEFVLLSDSADFGDPAWYVYELERGQRLPSFAREAHNTDGVLFWNYSEDGGYTDDPHLEIRDRRYLVFSRGGRYHGLYDITKRRVLVNEECPWWSYRELPKSEQDRWVFQNLHAPIHRILSAGKPSPSKVTN
ncbi:MAG TPA: hypothetical protein V6D00_06215 [Pantanalinema sp.]